MRRAEVFLASDSISKAMKREYPHHRIESIGSSWAYLLKSMNKIEGAGITHGSQSFTKNSQNVLFFVRHFNLRAGFKYTPEVVSQIGIQVREQFPNCSLTFCVFWSDLLSFDWNDFSRQFDIRIVCAGVRELNPPWEMHDARTKFLPKLLDLIEEHDVCAFDTYTSAVPYALSLGKKIRLLRLQYEKAYPPFGKVHDWFTSEFAFEGDDEIYPEPNRGLVSELLGFKHVMSPEEFKDSVPMIRLRTLYV